MKSIKFIAGILLIVFLSFFLITCSSGGDGGGGSTIHKYKVIYNENDSTGGSVPIDSYKYPEGDNATVAGNTGNLVKTGYIFVGWNMQADGNGTTYTEGQDFRMGAANVTLYAKFVQSYTGTWNVNAYLYTNECDLDVNGTLISALVVNQSGNDVVAYDGAVNYTGTTNDQDGFTVSGIIPNYVSGCTGAAAYSFGSASDGNANVGFAIVATCSSLTCSVSYGGTAVRQSKGSILTKSDSMLESLMNECAQQTVGKGLDLSNESSPLDENGLKAKAIDAAKTTVSKIVKDSPVQ